MGQKPIHKKSPDETRSAIWAQIREFARLGKPFTNRDLRELIRLEADTIREYLGGLVAAGYLSRTDLGGGLAQPATYQLVRDCGVEAPRVRRDGTEITQGRSREQLWRTIRIMGEFSPRDLAINAATEQVPVAEIEAKNYVYHLHKAGYLALITPAKPGSRHTSGNQARYRLLASKNTGPLPPQVQRIKQVYDPNRKKVVWSENEGGAE